MIVLHSGKKAQEGFTLIEVIIAVAVFSLLMIVFASAVPLAEKTSHMNGQYSQAISLCQHKIDQMRAVGYGRINYTELYDAGTIDRTPSRLPFSFVGVDEVAEYLPKPVAEINVQDVGNERTNITVTITWRVANHKNKTSSATVSAIVANVE